MRHWSILAIGLGVGLFAGAQLASSAAAETALWAGVAISVAGMVLFVASPADAVDPLDAAETHAATTHAVTTHTTTPRSAPGIGRSGGARPTFDKLGPRVEQILRQAEEQAEALLREQRRQGEEIIAAAERDAGRIRAEAGASLWVVWRHDDNGNRFEVARVGSRADADALAAMMESRGHKQSYQVAEPR